MIYDPAQDSFLLAECVKKSAKNKTMLDLGTGSGIQALTAKKAGAKKILATDINKHALERLKIQGIPTRHSDLFEKISESFDLIVCNPPYLPEDVREDEESKQVTTGGKNGDEFILKFLSQAFKHLNPNGSILLLTSSLTPKKEINALIKHNNYIKKNRAKEKIPFEMLYVWEIRKRSFKRPK